MRKETDINMLETDEEDPVPGGRGVPRLSGAGQSSRKAPRGRTGTVIFFESEKSEEVSGVLGKFAMAKLLRQQDG